MTQSESRSSLTRMVKLATVPRRCIEPRCLLRLNDSGHTGRFRVRAVGVTTRRLGVTGPCATVTQAVTPRHDPSPAAPCPRNRSGPSIGPGRPGQPETLKRQRIECLMSRRYLIRASLITPATDGRAVELPEAWPALDEFNVECPRARLRPYRRRPTEGAAAGLRPMVQDLLKFTIRCSWPYLLVPQVVRWAGFATRRAIRGSRSTG